MSQEKSTPHSLLFNINEYVKVKLTPHGRRIHKEDHVNFWKEAGRKPPFEYTPPEEDADGWSKWQLHALMEKFGPYMCLIGPLCFETTIQVIGAYSGDVNV